MIPPLVPLAYFKKEPFYGSYQGMQYCVKKQDDVLLAIIYPAPYCFDVTPEEQKESREFSFTDEGRCEIQQWLNESFEAQSDIWSKAYRNL